MNWERQRRIVERKYKAKIRKVLLSAVKQVQADIELGGIEYAKNALRMEILNTELTNIYIQLYKETSIRFANIIYRELRIEVRKGASFGFNEEWAREAARFLGIEGIPLISTVTGNLRDAILKIIEEALTDGFLEQLSLPELIKKIISDLGEWAIGRSQYWAERIARTETVRGANYGAMQGARKHGFKTNKIWIAADDKRTRDSHRGEDYGGLDNQVKPLDEPFFNYEPIMQPGDPKASAKNTINCRCAVAFEPVRINGKLVSK